MRKAMGSVDDLIEEAKVRTVAWALGIFAISYFLTRKLRSAPLPRTLPSIFAKYVAIDERLLDARLDCSGWNWIVISFHVFGREFGWLLLLDACVGIVREFGG
jgi:hypothetical protein